MSKNEVAELSKFVVPVINSEIAQGIAEEMNGLTITFDRVKIPSGGGVYFEIPGDDPDEPETVKEIEGVILDHYPIKSFWLDAYTGQKTPPDCSSMDGRIGTGDPGGDCKKCPYNEFGSDENGIGKACKDIHRLYILRDGEMFPLLLALPPTSIKPFSDYIAKRIVLRGLRSYEVTTKITLTKAQNKGGITYSQAAFAPGKRLSQDDIAKVIALKDGLKPIMRGYAIADDEYITSNNDTETAEVPF